MRPSSFLRSQFRLYRLWILQRPCGGPIEAPPVEDDIQVRLLDRHARRDWICQRTGDSEWLQYGTALRHHHDLVVASRGDNVLGWAWIGYERVHLSPLGLPMRIPDDAAYLYDSWVKPEERSCGVGGALVSMRLRRAQERGVSRLLTHVVDGNHGSLRVLERHGFEIVGRTGFLRAMAVRLWTRAPVPAAT